MEQQNSQFKSYFLGTLDAEEVDGVELQILEEKEFAEMLELAENDLIETLKIWSFSRQRCLHPETILR